MILADFFVTRIRIRIINTDPDDQNDADPDPHYCDSQSAIYQTLRPFSGEGERSKYRS